MHSLCQQARSGCSPSTAAMHTHLDPLAGRHVCRGAQGGDGLCGVQGVCEVGGAVLPQVKVWGTARNAGAWQGGVRDACIFFFCCRGGACGGGRVRCWGRVQCSRGWRCICEVISGGRGGVQRGEECAAVEDGVLVLQQRPRTAVRRLVRQCDRSAGQQCHQQEACCLEGHVGVCLRQGAAHSRCSSRCAAKQRGRRRLLSPFELLPACCMRAANACLYNINRKMESSCKREPRTHRGKGGSCSCSRRVPNRSTDRTIEQRSTEKKESNREDVGKAASGWKLDRLGHTFSLFGMNLPTGAVASIQALRTSACEL